MREVEPDYQLIAYCCEYCAYAAADLAGNLRLQYPPEVKVVLLPCTGKMDVLLILEALEAGIDGVLVAGCLPGECHYLKGNLNARRRIERVQTILKEIGLEPERVSMKNLSSAMANEFAGLATEMVKRLATIGPNPLRKPGMVDGS